MSGKPLDLTGQKFTRLRVLGRSKPPQGVKHTDRAYWNCLCFCGQSVVVRTDLLTMGNTTSCGCIRNQKLSAVNFVDMTGKRFGFLEVESRAERPPHVKNHFAYWRLRCVCGNTVVKSGYSLRNNRYKDHCGCKDV